MTTINKTVIKAQDMLLSDDNELNCQTTYACSRCDDAIDQFNDLRTRISNILVLLAKMFRQDINVEKAQISEKNTQPVLDTKKIEYNYAESFLKKEAFKLALEKSKYNRIWYRYQIEKVTFNKNMNKDLEIFMSNISQVLINVYDNIFSFVKIMNENIMFAIIKLIQKIQSLFPWFIKKNRRNGHIIDNQTVANVLSVLKCYIDACKYQYVAICSETMSEYTVRQRDTINYYIHFLPQI